MAFRERGQSEREVAVAGLPEMLARATWVDRHVYSKGGLWLRFPDGREVFLPFGFDFFRVAGVRGHFIVRPDDVARFRTLTRRIAEETRTTLSDKIVPREFSGTGGSRGSGVGEGNSVRDQPRERCAIGNAAYRNRQAKMRVFFWP